MSECTVSMRGYGMSCKKQYSFSMYLIGRLFFSELRIFTKTNRLYTTKTDEPS
mgnify:CR=1 FL=1